MSTVGLTKAMREALEHRRKGSWFAVSKATQRRAESAGFIEARMLGNEGLSPRGHAALAAPRMTQAELKVLHDMDQWRGVAMLEEWQMVAYYSCVKNGWVDGESITPAGRTALNNVRAAMGSPDWKEGL